MTSGQGTVGTILAAALALALAPMPGAGASELPGESFEISYDELPPPNATKGVAKFPNRVERGDHMPLVPDGFTVTAFAEGFSFPRGLAVAPNGDVFLSEPNSRFARISDANHVMLLRDLDGDGVAESKNVFAAGFNLPQGLAVVEGALLVADLDGIWRLPYTAGETEADERVRLTPEGALANEEPGGHVQRNLAVSQDGQYLFASVGSRGNVQEEPLPHASVQRFNADGSATMTLESGLRNPSALAVEPTTGELYTVVNERDMMGDDLPPDYLTRIREGEFFGWPYAYADGRPDPKFGDVRPDLVEATVAPDVLFVAHSAPVGMTFYTAEQFPEAFRGDAFVSLHGSWNRSEPTGFKVVHVDFEDGRPAKGYTNFATGWLVDDDGGRPEVWGRPTGLAVAADGSLLLADDGAGVVWRIAYTGE